MSKQSKLSGNEYKGLTLLTGKALSIILSVQDVTADSYFSDLQKQELSHVTHPCEPNIVGQGIVQPFQIQWFITTGDTFQCKMN